MRRAPRLPALLVALLAVLGAACAERADAPEVAEAPEAADAELSDAEQALADAFAADFADEEDGLGVTVAQGECLATTLMDELGGEVFEEAGVTPEDVAGDATPGELLGEGAVSEDQASTLYTRWEDCVDLDAAFADGFQKEYDTDDATRECFRAGLADDELMRQYMIASFTSGEDLDPGESPLREIISLIAACTEAESGGTGGVLVDSIAASLAAGGAITPDDARCVAQSVVDAVGTDRLLEGAADGDFSEASPELQQAVVQAIAAAATACDVPLSQLGGG